MTKEFDKSLTVDGLFKERAERDAAKAEQNQASRNVSDEHNRKFAELALGTIIPTLGNLSAQLQVNGCKVKLTPKGPGLEATTTLAYPSVEMEITLPEGDPLPISIRFACVNTKTAVHVRHPVKGRMAEESLPLDMNATSDSIGQLVLRYVRGALLGESETAS